MKRTAINSDSSHYWSQKQKERQKTLQIKKRKINQFQSRSLYKVWLLTAGIILFVAFSIYVYQYYQRATAFEMLGNTITVKKGGDFQAALNGAKAGDTILLQAGAVFEGNFNLPKKMGNEFITIRSSANDAQLPPENTRIEPEKYSAILPKVSSINTQPVISAVDGAHHYRFIGIEFGGTKDGADNIIKIGTSRERTIEDLPHHIEFDRVYIHATSSEGQRRGIAANGKHIRIVNSYISGISRRGDESQAIAIWATDGPVEIINNYLEGAAENILFGGAGSYLKLVPTDCVVRDNHLNKPLRWRDEGWVVKNLLEIKNGRRLKIENNLMTNNWRSGQDGTAILFNTHADNGSATIIEDIKFIGNIVRGSGNGISVYGSEGSGGHNLIIRNNSFEDISGQKWNGTGYFMRSSSWNGLTIENNTIINDGNITNAYGPVKNFTFRNNIVFENEYGFKGDSTASGQPTIVKFFSNGAVTNNIIIGGNSSLYKEKNFFLNSINQVGFVNVEKRDYRLRSDSQYFNKGFNGERIGADIDINIIGGK